MDFKKLHDRKLHELPVVSTKLDVDCILLSKEQIKTPKDALTFLSKKMYDNASEQSIGLFLDGDLYPLCVASLGQGDQKNTVMSARDVLQIGLLCNATNIIIIHNHPSKDINTFRFHPSEKDILMADSIQKACSLCSMDMVDFIITSGYVNKYGLTPAFYSMRTNKLSKMVKKLDLPEEKIPKTEEEFEWDFDGEKYWSYGYKLEDVLKDNSDKYEFLDH